MNYTGNMEKVLSIIFFNNWQASNLLKIGNEIQEKIHLFDGNPFTLPVDAPPEVPRLILKNKDESVKLEISLEKAVLIVHDSKEDKLERSTEIINNLIDVIFKKFEWEINRLARVTIKNFNIDQPSITFVKNKYIKENQFDEAKQINLHWLKKKNYLDDKLNYWIKINTPEGVEKKDFKIIIDMNLIKNQERILNQKTINNFFSKSHSLIKESYDTIFV